MFINPNAVPCELTSPTGITYFLLVDGDTIVGAMYPYDAETLRRCQAMMLAIDNENMDRKAVIDHYTDEHGMLQSR